MTYSKTVEVTIPVLNEEETLEQQVNIVLDFFENELAEFPNLSLVIADNGSSDKTQEIAESLQKERPNLRYLRLEERGVGRALKASWGSSEADVVGYMDLDLATDLKYLPLALSALVNDECDIVSGSRLAKGSKVIGRTPLREFTSRVFNSLLTIYLRAKFSDGMCGFKFLQRKHLGALQEAGAESDGWFFATELLVVSEHLKLRMKDLPVTWTDDPNSKVKIVKLSIEYVKAMRELKEKLKGGG